MRLMLLVGYSFLTSFFTIESENADTCFPTFLDGGGHLPVVTIEYTEEFVGGISVKYLSLL